MHFGASDELHAVVTADGAWLLITAGVHVGIEIEPKC
jgi:hypothetical protein